MGLILLRHIISVAWHGMAYRLGRTSRSIDFSCFDYGRGFFFSVLSFALADSFHLHTTHHQLCRRRNTLHYLASSIFIF